MNSYINIYTDSPTAGGTDGTAISTDGASTNPLTVELDATTNESKIVTCAVRCEAGYKTKTDTTISFSGETKNKWGICATQDGTYADSLTITDTIEQKNILFYVKASSSIDEDPANDTSVTIKLATKIAAIVE